MVSNLKHGEQSFVEGVKVAPRFFVLVLTEFSSKELHPKECEDDDEEEEEEQQTGDWPHRVQQGRDQVPQGGPIPVVVGNNFNPMYLIV